MREPKKSGDSYRIGWHDGYWCMPRRRYISSHPSGLAHYEPIDYIKGYEDGKSAFIEDTADEASIKE